jgi:hypothetical protein
MHTVIEQRERRNTIFAGGLIGLVVAGTLVLASMLPPAIADEQPFRTLLNTGDELMPDAPLRPFFKPHWTIEPSVNTDIVKQVTVRKIGYGRTEFVDIVTTPTGTYSSDAIVSPYVRYPGIHDTRRGPEGFLAIWDGSEWMRFDADGGQSIIVIIAQ